MIVGGIELPLPGSRSWLAQHHAAQSILVQGPLYRTTRPRKVEAPLEAEDIRMGNGEAGATMGLGFAVGEWLRV